MNSNLIAAIDKEIGEPLNPLIFLFPPVLCLLPLLILAWAFLSMERVSPMVSLSLLDAALESEKDELTAVLCRSKGRPTHFALSNLRSRLTRKAEAALDTSNLSKIKVLCK